MSVNAVQRTVNIIRTYCSINSCLALLKIGITIDLISVALYLFYPAEETFPKHQQLAPQNSF